MLSKILFYLFLATIIYFVFGWMFKWLNSIRKKAEREEREAFERFDKSLNPPKIEEPKVDNVPPKVKKTKKTKKKTKK